ncbi:MAG TPA: hypothetical protein VK994_00100, partial [Bacteroidales bacterium]|nr:hypothetical protein [Bacteroidales bacterium]
MTITTALSGQHVLKIMPADSLSAVEIRKLSYNNRPRDQQAALKVLKRAVQYYYHKGFLTASIDSLVQDSGLTKAWFHTGEIYTTSQLRPGNADMLSLRQSGYKEKYYEGKALDPMDISKLFEKLLRYCENTGYPFATVKLDSITFSSDKSISASINLKLNHRVNIDTIMVKGNSKLHGRYIRNYFNIKE